MCCLSTLISTRARTFLCGRCSESSDNDTPIYHFARYLLQFVRIFSRTYCTVKPVFTYYILHITVPPDRYLLHFFFSIVSFSDEPDFNQTGNISPQKSTPGGQSLHSGTVVSAVSFIDPADCSVRDFAPLLIQVTNGEERGRRI